MPDPNDNMNAALEGLGRIMATQLTLLSGILGDSFVPTIILRCKDEHRAHAFMSHDSIEDVIGALRELDADAGHIHAIATPDGVEIPPARNN